MRSSTCKRLADLCAPATFYAITTANRSPEKLISLLRYLTNIGCFVKYLTLDLHVQERDDRVLAKVMNRCPNLQHLTVDHHREDKSDSLLLFAALDALPALTELSLHESSKYYWWRGVSYEDSFIHNMFDPTIKKIGSRLHYLKISGYGALERGGFESLIEDAPRLVELELYDVLHVGLRHSLAESRTWACAAHLQRLTFVRCGGLHANIFTKKLASGAFGHPQRVTLAVCGDPSDDTTPPGAIEWKIPALDIFELDHFATWEMEHLQHVHAKKVFLSRVWRQGPEGMYKMVIQQIAHKSAFPEAVEVHVTTDWSDEDFGELQRVCSTKGVKLVMREWRREEW